MSHHFFLPPDRIDGDVVRFLPEQEHQMRRVLRLRTGDEVVALDGNGQEYRIRLAVEGTSVTGHIEESRPNEAEPPVSVTLYQGMVKGSKFEMIVQKCTEIGISRFVPVLTARAVAAEPGESRQRRLETIAREAAEQSGRGRIPVIAGAVPLAHALGEAASAGLAILLWEEARSTLLRQVPLPAGVQSAALFVGPEGGFTPEESRLATHSGLVTAGLGPRILRAETAAIAGSALLLDRLTAP